MDGSHHASEATTHRDTWQAGNYTTGSGQVSLASELLCEAVDLRAGERVLDVACGTGATALAASRRQADVVGVDFATKALQVAIAQSQYERLDNIAFIAGNAESLPFADGSFDVVLSTFGAQFAADQPAAAGELVRICRPGGRIGLANWSPGGFFGQFFKLMADYAPPQMRKIPVPDRPGVLWGTGERIEELFAEHVESIELTRRTSRSRYRSVEDWVKSTQQSLGPMLRIVQGLDVEQTERFLADLTGLARSHNRSPGPDLLLESEYLEVVMVGR